MRLHRDDALAASPRQAGTEQSRAGGGHAQGNALQAQGRGQKLAVAHPVLQRQRQPIFGETVRQLPGYPFRLPGFDQHQRIARSAAVAGLLVTSTG